MRTHHRTLVSLVAAAALGVAALGSAESTPNTDAPENAEADATGSLDDLDLDTLKARTAEAGFADGLECVRIDEPVLSITCTGAGAGGSQHAEVSVAFWDSASDARASGTVLSEDIPREVRGRVAANATVLDGTSAGSLRDALLTEPLTAEAGWLEKRLGAVGATDLSCESEGDPPERTDRCTATHEGGAAYVTLRLSAEPGEPEDVVDAGIAYTVRDVGELSVSVSAPDASRALLDAIVR